MTPDRERDLERICQAALDRPVAEREAFLAEACDGNDALRRDVEALLVQAGAASSFLETPVLADVAQVIEATGQALTIGQQVGSYTVVSALGSGGMGEVYRARDARLGREVALKVLPSLFTRDPERLARFEREARLLASLNHPNIATIHGVEHVDGLHALVLEVVEGQTLAERLQSRAGRGLAPSEALTVAHQIAEALEAAHEKGVIHRDLKPANIKIRPDGVVKVLDFGLAKAAPRDALAADASQAHTQSVGPTREGTILGTAAYMSPEQARGQAVDRRTDIWAFGCVLYELLTGRAAFGGATFSDTIAAILEREPDWPALPATTPVPVQSLLRRCLQKDPTKRLRDIGDARFQIEEVLNAAAWTVAGTVTMPTPKTGQRLWAAALVGAVAITAATAWSLRRTPLEPEEVRLEVTAPPTTDPASLAISPDGKQLVFAATTDGTSRLWVRPLNAAWARPLAGTENGRFPFWSPDSRSVGFTAGGQLKRIDGAGGAVRVLVPNRAWGGGTWNQDGTILFDIGPGGGLSRVSADGGGPTPITQINPQTVDPYFPQFLPDHRHFLYYGTGSVPGIYLGQLESADPPRRLLDAQAATYAASGHLLFVHQRTLFAQAFDPVRLELSGNPTVVAEQLVVGQEPGAAALSASAAGPVVYRTGPAGARSQFVWFDRSGKLLETVPGSDSNGFNSSLSPDGRRLAFSRFSEDLPGRTADIWLLDLARGVASRFTSDPMFDLTPVWSPDGHRLAFSSNRARADGLKGNFDVYVKAGTGLGAEERLVGGDFGDPPSDWSPDGRFILYHRGFADDSNDIWALPVHGDREPFPVVETMFNEANGQFSPNGKWIAFQSNESGQVEVYVQPFPGPGRRTRISLEGGDQPRWRHDGNELFYLTPDNRLMAVPMRLNAEGDIVDPGLPALLFAPRLNGTPRHPFGRSYSVSRDGQRFLVDTLKEATLPITVVLNWKPRP